MGGFITRLSEFSALILPWLGATSLIMQMTFAFFKARHGNKRSPISYFKSEAKMCTSKTGYVGAFMAKQGIYISLSLFLINVFDGIILEGQNQYFVKLAILFLSVMVLLRIWIVLSVSNEIIKKSQVGHD